MKLSGRHTIAAPREQVWDALQDPAVLARTLPGCTQLEVTGPDRYAATIDAGVASAKGIYHGEVSLADMQAPSSYTLVASGAGAPGTVRARAQVQLEDSDGATTIHYDADAVVGGMIGGVGQRMLASVAQRTATDFFTAVEHDLVHGPAAPPEPAPPGAPPPSDGGQPAAPTLRQVSRGPAGPAGEGRRGTISAALLVGAPAALAGAVVGWWFGRTSR